MYGSDIKAGGSARNERIPGNSEEPSMCWKKRTNKQKLKFSNFSPIYKGSKEGKKPLTFVIL